MTAALICLILLAAAPQHPRSPQNLDPSPGDGSYYPVLASRDDLSACAFVDGTYSDQVMVAVSDGRGLTWSSPVRVDAGPAGYVRRTVNDSVAVWGDRIYVAWEDARFGGLEVYFSRSLDGGTTWLSEMLVPKGYPAGVGGTHDWRMVVSPDAAGGADHVYFLLHVYSAAAPLIGELYLVASNDGGATFGVGPVHVPAGFVPGAADVDEIDLDARSSKVMVLWTDDRTGSNNVFFQRSPDGGVTWLPADRWLNNLAPGSANGAVSLSSSGSNVMAGWVDDRMMAPNDELRVARSTDGGATWNPDEMIGNYLPGLDDVTWFDILVDGVNWHAAWTDDRFGLDYAFAAHSPAVGTPWAETLLSGGEAGEIRLTGHRETVSASWLAPAAGTGIQAAVARDGITGWEPEFTVVTAPPGDLVQAPVVNFNDRYDNYLHAWVHHVTASSQNQVEVGGFRPQTLNPSGGFTAGALVNFEVAHFPVAWAGKPFALLVSSGAGTYTLPYGDGRLTGLAMDSYLGFCLANIPGICSGSIDAGGSGATPVITWPASVPVGTLMHSVAVAYSIGGGGPIAGPLTDVETFLVY